MKRESKRKWLKTATNIVLFLLYCFPFAFECMNIDYEKGLMTGNLVMIVSTSILALCCKLNGSWIPFVLGNIATAISSAFFMIPFAEIDEWAGYFKPLSPYTLMVWVVVLNLIPQFIAMKLAKNVRTKEE